MSTDSNSTGLNSVTATDTSEKFWRWFAQIAAAVVKSTTYFLPASHPVSDGERAQSALEEAGAIAAATENVVANLTTTKSFTVTVSAGLKVDTDTAIDNAAATVLDQDEIQRRRDLVRMLFNDFWSGAHDKPAAFAERLDQAEDYVNERLSACGEFWQLDAATRLMLGLPTKSSANRCGS
ncbi:MAG TPA: hypothetical protein VER26_15715 [Xanthobacteraceae bacterium]|nr:hypothetical protein [Xanthobacteraceae bacterium]